MTDLAASGLSTGDAVPDFDLPASASRRVRLAALHGRPFVMYFYPKADTSGCTQEALAFQQALDAAGREAIPVLGISKDPIAAIDAFAASMACASRWFPTRPAA